jgi:hypothetical protein
MKYGQHWEKLAIPIFKLVGPVSVTGASVAWVHAAINTARINKLVKIIVRFIIHSPCKYKYEFSGL